MIFKMSIQASLLLIAILLLRSLFRKRLPDRFFLVFWAVAVLRLLIPVSIPASFGMESLAGDFLAKQNVFQSADVPSAGSGESADGHEDGMETMPVMGNENAAGIEQTDKQTAGKDLPGNGYAAWQLGGINAIKPWLIVIWLMGAAFGGVLFLSRHLKSRRRYAASLPVSEEFAAEWRASHRLRRNVSLRYFDQIKTPLTYGVFCPVILLPKAVLELEGQKLDYILTHEWIHICRFDTLAKWFLAAALCLHWFNPLVWVMYVLANRDMELSCDAGVMKRADSRKRKDYALCLIEMEEQKAGFLSLSNCFSKNATEERVKRIMEKKKVNILIAALCGVALCTAAFFFGTTMPAKSGDLAQNDSGRKNNTIKINEDINEDINENISKEMAGNDTINIEEGPATEAAVGSSWIYPKYEKIKKDEKALKEEYARLKESLEKEFNFSMNGRTEVASEAVIPQETPKGEAAEQTSDAYGGEVNEQQAGMDSDYAANNAALPSAEAMKGYSEALERLDQVERLLGNLKLQKETEEAYGTYGVTFDLDEEVFKLNGVVMHCFIDNTDGDENNFSGKLFVNQEGKLHVEVQRDENGKVTGIKEYKIDEIPEHILRMTNGIGGHPAPGKNK